jgi:predicted transcriptional regulator of viral defense system
MMNQNPDFECLFEVASEQHGYFVRGQAEACGFSRQLIRHHTNSSTFLRIYRGVYRLKDYPAFPREEVVAAWLAVGKDVAVVSHESALDLHDLSDVIPNAVHLTVLRSMRNLPKLPGVKIHTTTREFAAGDVVTREGMRVTSVERTIVDSADWGTGSEQIEMAVRQAFRRGVTSPKRLETAVAKRSARVRNLINRAIAQVEL